MQKGSHAVNLITAVLFWSLIGAFGIGIFILPPEDFSKSEGRSLARFPEYRTESLVDGSFFEGLSDFYSDQLPLREYFGNIYALSEFSLGKREVNGAVLCSNGALVLRSQTNERTFSENLDAISNILQGERQAVFFAVPAPSGIFSDSMPLKASSQISSISNACSREFLSRASTEPTRYYYRTDHHWTTQGAYLSYSLICQELGITPYGEDFFEEQTVCEEFYGSAFRRSSLPRAVIDADSITLYRYDGDGELLLTDHSTGQTSKGLYDFEEIDNGDAYRVFLGGNSAHLTVESTTPEVRKKLLILKDSYANSLVSFLALHYDIDMIDPRYAEPSTVEDLCASKDFDAILVLLSESTLGEERSISVCANIIAQIPDKKH